MLIATMLALVSACGAPGSVSGASRTNASPTPTAVATPVASPSNPPSGGGFATCPATISNRSGSYSFSCPAGWTYLNCEATDFSGAYTWLLNPGGCRSEAYGARMMVWSLPGDHSADPENQNGMYVGARQSSQAVVVSGATGTRRTYLVTAENPLPPPRDAAQVLYTFVTRGRTYFAQYDRYPGEPDQTASFDQMVVGSLAFSA